MWWRSICRPWPGAAKTSCCWPTISCAGFLRTWGGLTDEALNALTQYSWPGNVRELENLLQRLVVIGEGQRIDITDLPESMRFSLGRNRYGDKTLAEVEAEHIRHVLSRVGGNKTKTA